MRSGEYKQCRELYRKGDTFCCLSVLATRVGYDKGCDPGTKLYDWEIDLTDLGMTMSQVDDFIEANDTEKLTFDEIADRIEDGRLKC